MGLSMHLYRKQKVSKEVADSLDGKSLDYIPENSLYKYNSEATGILELSGLASLYVIDTLVLENIICE